MKAAVRCLLALLTVASACRTAAPPARNTLPRHQAITESTIPETGEPSRKAGLALPDSSRRDLPQQP